jgi:hypothetical protein
MAAAVCDRRMLVRGSVDLDAPEIHSGNPYDTCLAFEHAEEFGRVRYPFLVAWAKERSPDTMQRAAIEHELAFQHIGKHVAAPRAFAAVSAGERSIFFRRAEAARSRIPGVYIPVRAVADLNYRPRLFMGVGVAGRGSARRLRF